MVVIYDPLLAGTVRVLDTQGQTVGTGFLIAHSPERQHALIATSTRVVERATSLSIEYALREKVHVIFQQDTSNTRLESSIASWSSSDREDVSVLRIEGILPKRVRTLPLRLATASEGRKVTLFGYPTHTEPFLGAWRYADICRSGPRHAKTELPFLQLDSRLITEGYSGAPVWDDEYHNVIGIVTQVVSQDGQDAYAAPVEVLRLVQKDVEAITPSPYHGLAPFPESDATSFFGYDAVINRMTQKLGTAKLSTQKLGKEPNFLTVLGPAGSGKSSVVQAGLLHKLRHGEVHGYEEWGMFRINLLDAPFQQLEAEGMEEASLHLSKGIYAWLQKHGNQRLVFVLDQFERFLEHCPQEIQNRFVQQLLDVLHERTATVILILRDESYHLLAKHEALMEWVEECLINVFAPHTKEALLDIAMRRSKTPGTIQDIKIHEHLIERILRDESRGSQRSILARYELSQTLYQEQMNRSNGESDTDAISDSTVVGVDEWAEALFSTLSGPQQAFAQYVFTQVVLQGDESLGIPDTGREIHIPALCQYEPDYQEAHETVYILADKRLLVTGRDRKIGQETVRIAQDDLIHEWRRLREWLREDREHLAWQQEENKRQQQLTLAHELSVQAMDHYTHHQPQIGIQVAVDALGHAFCPEADQALRDGLLLLSYPISSITVDDPCRIAFSSSRQYSAVVQEEHYIDIVDMATGQQCCRFQHESPVTLMAFDNTAEYLVTVSKESRVFVWKMSEDVAFWSYREAHAPILIKWSLDGRYLAVANWNGARTTITIWEVELQRKHSTLYEDEYVNAIDFNHDNTLLATGGKNGTVRVWTIASKKGLFMMRVRDSVHQVAFSAGSHHLAIASKGIVVLNMETHIPLVEERHNASARALLFGPQGNYIATGSDDGVTRVWEIPTGRKLAQLTQHGPVHAIAFSFDSTYLATAGEDTMVHIWEMGSNQEIMQLLHEQPVRNVTFSMDKHYLFSLSDERVLRVWKTVKSKLCTTLVCQSPVTLIACSTHNDILYLTARCENNTVWHWQVDDANEQQTFRYTRQAQVCSLAHSSNGQYSAIASVDGYIQILDTVQTQEIVCFSCNSTITKVLFCLDNDFLAILCDNSSIQIWEWKTTRLCSTTPLNTEEAFGASTLSPDEHYLGTVGKNGTVQVWEWKISRPTLLFALPHPNIVTSIHFSTDGRIIATVVNKKVYLWNTYDRTLVSVLTHNSEISAITLSPDSHYLATASNDERVRIWEATTGRLVSNLPQDALVRTLAYSHDGMYLVVGSLDGRIRVWLWRVEDLMHQALLLTTEQPS